MKLTVDQLKDIENKAENIYDFKPKPIKRFWSVEELAKGKLFSQSMNQKIMRNLNQRRQQHRLDGWKGWTKNKRMRSEVRIPIHVYLQPEFQKRYFADGMDEKEKNKALERLKSDFPQYKTHD